MRTCCIGDCAKPVKASGMCGAHYQRLRKYGDPTVVKKKQLHGLTISERLAAYTVKSDGDGCWEWSGSRDARGYGRLNVKNIPQLVHRLAWIEANGEIPEGAHVCHRCDNPACLKPDHMFIGSHADNMADMWGKGRARPGLMQGEKHGMAVLTEAQVLEIRASVGASHIVGERYGISGRQVRAIRNRESWTHLEE